LGSRVYESSVLARYLLVTCRRDVANERQGTFADESRAAGLPVKKDLHLLEDW
jgi:hypothetical protein